MGVEEFPSGEWDETGQKLKKGRRWDALRS